MAKPEEYGVSVRLIQEDGMDLYEARVAELPDVRTYGETFGEAYSGALEVIRTTQEIFAEKGRAFPALERPEDEFSGRVTLRMSKSLHRCAHENAATDGVSLNQWLIEAIGCRVNRQTPEKFVLVMSQKRNVLSRDVSLCLQPATHIKTGQLPTGSTVSIYATNGVLEHDASSLSSTTNLQRRLLT